MDQEDYFLLGVLMILVGLPTICATIYGVASLFTGACHA